MSLIKKYKQLEKKADQYFGKHETECVKMLGLITPLLKHPMPFDDQYVFKQAGDGYVLVTQIGNLAPHNTPVEAIINWNEFTGMLIDINTLDIISI